MAQEVVTKRDIATGGMEALDRERVGKVVVAAGGVTFSSALEMMEFAKLMAVSQQAIPPDFRNNPGMCLGVLSQAIEWRMSPFQVINKAYIVNDRIAWESQLVHAVIESRAPLQKRLRCSYAGEGLTRVCKVWGTFVGEDAPHEYESPQLSKIKKKSPLWVDDPDQQLFYYASRAWARRHAPDVLLGIYTKEEIEAIEPDTQQIKESGLHARLTSAQRTEEGHRDGHATKVLADITGTAKGEQKAETDKPAPEGTTNVPLGRRRKRGRTKPATEAPTGISPKAEAPTSFESDQTAVADDAPPKGSPADVANRAEAVAPRQADPGPQAPNPTEPNTVAEYITYAERWIDKAGTFDDAAARWDGESDMRDALAVPINHRNTLKQRMRERFNEVD